jgi:hypothetical protein
VTGVSPTGRTDCGLIIEAIEKPLATRTLTTPVTTDAPRIASALKTPVIIGSRTLRRIQWIAPDN